MDTRTQVMQSLIDLLAWDQRQALTFLDALTESECADILEHVRESGTPIVGVAAVVYRVRLRLAGSDQAARQRAGEEANKHFKMIPLRRAVGHADLRPDEQPQRIYNVSPLEWKRREHNGR